LHAHVWNLNCSYQSQVTENTLQPADRYTYSPISTRDSNELWLKFITFAANSLFIQ